MHPVLKLVVQRIALGLVLLLAVSAVIFLGVEALPGDTAQAILGQSATPQALENLRAQMGLDQPALTRRRCAWTAMAVAEHFRDQGLHVLLLADSVTRFAEAHREVALAGGERSSMSDSMIPGGGADPTGQGHRHRTAQQGQGRPPPTPTHCLHFAWMRLMYSSRPRMRARTWASAS